MQDKTQKICDAIAELLRNEKNESEKTLALNEILEHTFVLRTIYQVKTEYHLFKE